MNLVIVESPSKTKTIKEFLGNDYNVVASKGHIRDIENCGVDNLGIDIENGFKPIYEILPHQNQTVAYLNDCISKCDNIYLATDPDREGEAISWHLKETLNLSGKTVKRIEFNEITFPAIKAAIESPRDIDYKLFESQETRKIMDRMIGYKLSTILKKETGNNPNTSAGRVQSVCLKLINEREALVKAFVPTNYYQIEATFDNFKAKLVDKKAPSKPLNIESKEVADNIFKSLTNDFKVKEIKDSTKYEKPFPPFDTSSLFQAALSKYSMSSNKTLKVAQSLYEGIEVDGKHIALLTYIRTDSTRMSDVFKKELYFFIKDKYGEEYVGQLKSKKNDNSQDAHECIRPVSLKNTPELMEKYLTKDQIKIYTLVYNQTVESMMKDSIVSVRNVLFENNNNYFNSTFEQTTFAGFKKNRIDNDKEVKFDKNVDDVVVSTKNELLSKETEGPKRYTEATLIKEMESSGIGRPSTYASTIETLKKRKYVNVLKNYFIPTKEGEITYKYLDTNFSNIINVDYTAQMEKTLDEIALGNQKEEDVVPVFYNSLIDTIKNKKDTKVLLETGDVCPNCGSKMVYRFNKFGSFEACSNYPTCKYIKKQETSKLDIECPECHEGHLIERKASKGKYKGRSFYGCSNYPKCTFTISSLKDIKK